MAPCAGLTSLGLALLELGFSLTGSCLSATMEIVPRRKGESCMFIPSRRIHPDQQRRDVCATRGRGHGVCLREDRFLMRQPCHTLVAAVNTTVIEYYGNAVSFSVHVIKVWL